MAAKDLVTLSRAKQNIQAITDSSQDSLLNTLITAVSDAIRKYCNRDFVVTTYDELYSGTGDRRMQLRQYPIQSISWVRYRYVVVLKVQNTNTATNQQARVAINSTQLTLSRVASGVTTTNNLTFAGNVTLGDMATAIIALGSGWTAQVVGDSNDYGKWPSQDLYIAPSFGDGTQSVGNLNCRGQFAELKMHTAEFSGYEFDPRGWLLRTYPFTEPEASPQGDYFVWPVGLNNFRVKYSAGFATIPEGVQEACAEWVAELYWMTYRDPAASDLTIAGTQSSRFGRRSWSMSEHGITKPSDFVARLLAPYRRITIGTNQG